MSRHDEQHEQHDERLRARLRAVDPASSLAPADPAAVARLLEVAMSETDERREVGRRRRAAATWLAGAAAVLVVGGVTLAAILGGDPSTPPPGAADDPERPAAVLTLEAPAAAQGRCAMPSARLLAAQEIAFLGTVAEVGDEAVELAVEEAYAGVEASTVEVITATDGLPSTVREVDFREGERYLVSATDGLLTVCGSSGPATPELQALYDEAFGE